VKLLKYQRRRKDNSRAVKLVEFGALVLISECLLLLLFPPTVYANASICQTYNLKQSVASPLIDYRLNITIQQETYAYYQRQSHVIASPSDIVKFVTPGPVKPIADLLWSIYNNSEDYVNGVLMLVHQIFPNTTKDIPPKYPVEYLAEKVGDCEVSYLTASLTIAGGLKTILMLWETSEGGHVNVGVGLDSPPKQVRTTEYYYVTVNGVNYYVAESSGDKWETGWRVGELPKELVNLKPKIVQLDKVSWNAPAGLVSASFETAQMESAITIERLVPLIFTYQVSGRLNPPLSNQTISLYLVTKSTYTLLSSTATKTDGEFTLTYTPLYPHEIMYGNLVVVWNGNEEYKATSIKLNVFGFDTFVHMPFWLLFGFIIVFAAFIKKV